jgi:hypothetical protein
MADNTCHFGLNHFFADNGLMDASITTLYFISRKAEKVEKTPWRSPLLPNPNPAAAEKLPRSMTPGANRSIFGEAVNEILDKLSKEEAKRRVMVIDSDLENTLALSIAAESETSGSREIAALHDTRWDEGLGVLGADGHLRDHHGPSERLHRSIALLSQRC